jgi:hypothetical protein
MRALDRNVNPEFESTQNRPDLVLFRIRAVRVFSSLKAHESKTG